MEKFEYILSWIRSTIIGASLFLFGDIGQPLQVMATFIILDYFTGYSKSFLKKDLSSRKGYRGIIKKTAYIVAVIMGFALDKLILHLGINEPIEFLGVAITFRDIIVYGIIGTEGISLIENLGELGVPFPKVIKDLFEKFKK